MNRQAQSARIGASGPDGRELSVGLHRFAIIAAAATLALIFIGSLVTTTGSAMAIPSWPLAAGDRLIPAAWGHGVIIEWGHRAAAGTVSILTLVLMVWALIAEPRRWVRALAVGAFVLIIIQALLGGLRVMLNSPVVIAGAHAATAYIFFCVMVALALFTNPRWEAFERRPAGKAAPGLATLAVITAVVIYFQILIGDLMRHLGAGLVIPDFPLNFGHLIPPHFDEYIAINFAHRCGALVVTILIVWTVVRVLRRHADVAMLRHAAELLIVLLVLQVSLGASIVWTHRAVIPTGAHVMTGGAVLATALALAIRSFRLLEAGQRSEAPSMEFVPSTARTERKVIA